MTPLLHLKLRHKLTLITMLTSIVVLVLACGAFLGYELLTFQRTMSRDLAMLGDVIGDNSTAALTFDDTDAAKGVLASLRAQQHVVSACMYGPDGRPFATYRRDPGNDAAWPDQARDDAFERNPSGWACSGPSCWTTRTSAPSTSAPTWARCRRACIATPGSWVWCC